MVNGLQQYSSRWTFFLAFHEFDIVHWFCRWNRFYQFCVVIDGCFFLHSLRFCFSTLGNMNRCEICPRNCLGVFLTIFMEKLKNFFDYKRAWKKKHWQLRFWKWWQNHKCFAANNNKNRHQYAISVIIYRWRTD